MQVKTIDNVEHVESGFYHPGLASVSNVFRSDRRIRVLDLGAPCAASFTFFKHQNCSIRFENLNDFLANAIAKNVHRNGQAFIASLDSYLMLKSDERFDVILTWDIFCYLDLTCVEHLSRKLARHAAPDARLHMVRYWGNNYPVAPCDYFMVDALRVLNNFDRSEKRHLQKIPTVNVLQKSMIGFKLSEFYVDEENMHPAMTDAVFDCQISAVQIPQKTQPQKTLSEPAVTSSGNASTNKLHPYQSTLVTRPKNSVFDREKAIVTRPHTYYGHHKSSAIENLFKLRLGRDRHILDLSAFNKQNESIYRRYTPQIYFADLPRFIASHTANSVGGVLPSLPLAKHWVFDVVMGWDVLCRYDQQTISQIMAILKPHVHAGTYMHLLNYVGIDDCHYLQACNLESEDSIELVDGGGGFARARNSIFDLICAMGYGKIERSYLFGAGMHPNYQEYVVELTE